MASSVLIYLPLGEAPGSLAYVAEMFASAFSSLVGTATLKAMLDWPEQT